MRYSRIGDRHTLPELQVLECSHAAQNLEAAIGNLRHSGIISSQLLKSADLLCCGIPCVPAIHAIQRIQIFALTYMAEPGVWNVNRNELTQLSKPRQCR